MKSPSKLVDSLKSSWLIVGCRDLGPSKRSLSSSLLCILTVYFNSFLGSGSMYGRQWIYDVFINFRGQDTRQNFVSHLYAALSNAGVNIFLDDEKLERGEELKETLCQAIRGSRISLVVFSETYAESSWCLYELQNITKCHTTYGQVVIPIFYHVDPSDVRHRKGAFGEALKTLSATKSGLATWGYDLTQAANLSGWDVRHWRSEAELVKKIVEDVLTKLDITLLSTTEFLVGLESRVQEVIRLITDRSSKVCIVGIWGMGGSGKTTTAKAIYNQIQRKFDDKSFIENIREVCENDKGGYIHLQKQLLSDILKTKVKIQSIASGTIKIQKSLCVRRMLVVLDDINKLEQLKTLCGNRNWFGPGSLLIVTTRDVRLLNLLKVDHVYKMEEMDTNESLELFSWHAFRESSPTEDFSELSKSVVAYCGGLPLALEVIGSYLYERTKPEWSSVILKLGRIPHDQVQEKLRMSYDGLKDDMEKDIFLDICCFFIGKDRAYVTEILNGCSFYADIGITVLIERSLLKVEKNNKLGMHNLLRDMGREIVRQSSMKEPGKRSRLWFHEDVHDVLTKKTGTETIEGLKLQRTGRVRFSTNAFKEMNTLRLLHLDCVDLTGDYGYLSKELRWVNWQRSTFRCIPDDFDLGHLVVIDLKYSNIKQLWKETKMLGKLKILNLSHSRYMKNTPDFSKLPNLEKLILKDCPSLSEVHESIGDLKNLILINLKDCTSLSNLPRKIYKLKSVQTLILSGCSKIDKLEEDIVQMESLTTLIAKGTAVKEVPHSIVRSKSIGYISLCGYEGLSRDVFPSLIWSWTSPTMNPFSHIHPFDGMLSSLVSVNVENNNLGNLSPILSSLSKLRSFWVQCRSEVELTQQLRSLLDDLYDRNFTEMETTAHATLVSNLSLRSLLIGMGSYHGVVDALGKTISQGLTTNDSSNIFLPGDNYPSWLAYKGEGPSVHFQVPEDSDCGKKGIILCVVYSSTPENMADGCLSSVLIINYTKLTIQIYKRDTVMSFNDEDWQGVISNLGAGDTVEILVAFGHGLIVKKTAVYLISDQSITVEIEPSNNIEVEPFTNKKMELLPAVDVQPSPNVKTESSPEVNVQPSPNVKMEPFPQVDEQPSPNVKMEPFHDTETEPSLKPNKNTFTRLKKRMGECLCLNQK